MNNNSNSNDMKKFNKNGNPIKNNNLFKKISKNSKISGNNPEVEGINEIPDNEIFNNKGEIDEKMIENVGENMGKKETNAGLNNTNGSKIVQNLNKNKVNQQEEKEETEEAKETNQQGGNKKTKKNKRKRKN